MKTLQELTLLDKFLFDEVVEDRETYEALLRIILGEDELNLLTESQTEKEFRLSLTDVFFHLRKVIGWMNDIGNCSNLINRI